MDVIEKRINNDNEVDDIISEEQEQENILKLLEILLI